MDRLYPIYNVTAAVEAQVQLGGEDQDHWQQLHGGRGPHARPGGRRQAACQWNI